MSMRSIEEMLTEVAEEDLALEPRAELKRRALLEKALAFYEDLQRVEPDDPELAWRVARAARKVGDIQRLLGRYPEALAAYDRALERLAPLEREPPAGTDPTREIADVHNFVGEVYRLRGDPCRPWRRTSAPWPSSSRPWRPTPPVPGTGRTCRGRGTTWGWWPGRWASRPSRSASWTRRPGCSTGCRPPTPASASTGPASSSTWRGPVENRDLAGAERACREAVALFDGLIVDTGGRPDLRWERTAALSNLGLVLQSHDDPAGAKAALTEARDVLAGLADDFKATPRYRADLAQAYDGLAGLAFGQAQAARGAFDALAAVAGEVGSAAEAADMSGRAAAARTAVVADRDTPENHGALGVSLGNQGLALERLDPARARALLTRGLTEVLVGLCAARTSRGSASRSTTRRRPWPGCWCGPATTTRPARWPVGSPPNPRTRSGRPAAAAALLAACLAAGRCERWRTGRRSGTCGWRSSW